MHRFLANVLAAAAVVVVATTVASADPKPMTDAARRELERGLSLFTAREYDRAIATFDAGFAIEPHPDFLYAKGQAQRMNGDCEGAVASYRGFLASSPPEEEAKLTRFNLARCEAELARTRRAPLPERPVPVELAADPWYRDPLGGVLAGGGVIGVAVGVTFLVLADRSVDRANDADDLETYLIEADRADGRRLIGKVSLVLGGALVTAAIVRYATRPSKVELVGGASTTGAVVGIRGSF
jgi:hypothetical protein